MSSVWKAVSDDSRRQILIMLKDGEKTPSQILTRFDFTLPALSTHLKVLKSAGLVNERKEGQNRFYSINQKQSLELVKFFENMWGYKMDSLKEFVENKERKKKQ